MKVLSNIAANGIARLWSAALQFLMTPIFVKLLGAQSFGLIAFYNTMVLTFVFLDWAISPAVTREFACMSGRDGVAQKMANLLRTFESVTWLVAFLLAVLLFTSAGWITGHWLNIGNLQPAVAIAAVQLMSFVLVAQWPLSLYNAGFVALFRQSIPTAIRIVGLSFQFVGAALLL
jgi:O-antigen/teichoic acid export membrane protein